MEEAANELINMLLEFDNGHKEEEGEVATPAGQAEARAPDHVDADGKPHTGHLTIESVFNTRERSQLPIEPVGGAREAECMTEGWFQMFNVELG